MKTKPSQTMREFFERDDIKALQSIQKRTPGYSPEHQRATAEIYRLACEVGAGEYFELP